MAAVRRATGKRPPAAPDLPWVALEVWRDFIALHETRGGGMGAQAIRFVDIKAYGDTRGFTLSPWAVEMIRVLDREFLSAMADGEKEGVAK